MISNKMLIWVDDSGSISDKEIREFKKELDKYLKKIKKPRRKK